MWSSSTPFFNALRYPIDELTRLRSQNTPTDLCHHPISIFSKYIIPLSSLLHNIHEHGSRDIVESCGFNDGYQSFRLKLPLPIFLMAWDLVNHQKLLPSTRPAYDYPLTAPPLPLSLPRLILSYHTPLIGLGHMRLIKSQFRALVRSWFITTLC